MTCEIFSHIVRMPRAPDGTRMTSSEKVLLLMLDWDDRDGTAWASTATLARQVGVTVRSIERIRAGLVRKGMLALEHTQGSHRAVGYRLLTLDTGHSVRQATPCSDSAQSAVVLAGGPDSGVAHATPDLPKTASTREAAILTGGHDRRRPSRKPACVVR